MNRYSSAFVALAFSMVLAVACEACGSDKAEPVPNECEELIALLKTGRGTKALPADVVVRIEANLSRSAAADDSTPKDAGTSLQEIWELTPGQVHRIIAHQVKDQNGRTRLDYRRVESRPCDTSGLCQSLLDADVAALSEGQGGGSVHFVGTGCNIGHRQITITAKGKELLCLGEACTSAGFTEADAQKFAALYEDLARRARGPFAK